MSKVKQQDESLCSKHEMTYLVIRVTSDTQTLNSWKEVEPNMQDEVEAKKRVDPKYGLTKDRIIKEWVSDLDPEYLAKHYLLKSSDTQEKKDFSESLTEFEDNYDFLLRNRRFYKVRELADGCENYLSSWLKIVSDYQKTKKLTYDNNIERAAKDGEPYYTVIESVSKISAETMTKILKNFST